MSDIFEEPPRDCPACPRLVRYRESLRISYPSYRNCPVPAFGPIECRLLIVGLAPGKSGANRTGRPFTGDYAGDLLYATLLKHGFASGTYAATEGDSLRLRSTRITNAVRCVPPGNKPERDELGNCLDYFRKELAALHQIEVLLALGRIAHDQVLAAFSLRKAGFPFRHGAQHGLPNGLLLIDSYHCSRYNTNTGRLTTDMFETVIETARLVLG